jgi:D-amino-acid oxidase
MCRTSFKRYQTFLGLPGAPVEWLDRYNLSDLSPDAQREKRHRDDPIGFVNYQPMVRDLTPQAQLLPAGSHPFPAPYVQRNTSMMFNIPEYGRVLTEDFLMGGGRIVMREFHEPGELTSLKEKVIINCTGYGARALWRDESVVPVRGQIAWLIPQTEVTYGMSYKNVSMLSRRDGIVMQYGGPNEGWGYNSTDETPHRDEAEIALAAYQELYAKMTAPRGLQVAAPVRS